MALPQLPTGPTGQRWDPPQSRVPSEERAASRPLVQSCTENTQTRARRQIARVPLAPQTSRRGDSKMLVPEHLAGRR
jgi:hypothetical protein